MKKISRTAALERLKTDCMSKDESLYISSGTTEKETYGECYVTDFQFSEVLQKGSLEDVMRERNLLESDEEILYES